MKAIIEQFKSIWNFVVAFRKLLLVVGVLSVISAGVNFSVSKPVYSTEFVIAPYFEMANNLKLTFENRLKTFSKSKSLLVNFGVKDFKVLIKDNGGDYSFKHKKVCVVFDLEDTTSLQVLDSLMLKISVDFHKSDLTPYRGIGVWQEKIKRLSSDLNQNIPDSVYAFYKNDFLKQNIQLTNKQVSQLILDQTKGEYQSALKPITISKPSVVVYPKKMMFSPWQLFVIITCTPVALTIILGHELFGANKR